MKRFRITLPLITFIAGIVVGLGILGVSSIQGSSPQSDLPRGVTPVSTSVANSAFRLYYSSAQVPTEKFKGFYFDTTQLNAVNYLHKIYKSVPGFRLYLAKDATSGKFGSIIVGVDNAGKDAVSGAIYMTTVTNPGPCPYVCDEASPIIKTQ